MAHAQQDSNENEQKSFRSETAQMNENILQFIKQNNLHSNLDLQIQPKAKFIKNVAKLRANATSKNQPISQFFNINDKRQLRDARRSLKKSNKPQNMLKAQMYDDHRVMMQSYRRGDPNLDTL